MCLIESNRADASNTKFGLRTMKSLRKTILLLGLAPLALVSAPLLAQQDRQSSAPPAPAQTPAPAAQQPQQPPGVRVQVNQVLVPVTVKDGSGRLVPDLNRTDFRIFEDSVEQKIVYFSADPVPLSLVLLIDNDLKRNDARQVAASLDAIVAGLSTSDEAFVCRFDQFFHEGKGFVSDQDRLLTELKRTRLDDRPSAGPTSAAIAERSEEHTSELQSRLHLVCRLLLEKKKLRRACAQPPACRHATCSSV